MGVSKNRRIKVALSEHSRGAPARGEAPHAREAPPIGDAPPPALDGHRKDFTFEFHGPRIRITDSTMIEALRMRHAQINGPFTVAQFNAWADRPCGGGAIQRRFGSWRRALKTAGIEGGKGRNYTPEELMQNLEAAWRSLGRRPGPKTLSQHGTIGVDPYNRVWGGLRRACQRFAMFKRGQITRKELLRAAAPRCRQPLSPGTRWRILQAARHRCGGCGRTSRDRGVRLEVDHIIPVSAGGTDDAANLRVLCLKCNRGKGGAGRPGPRNAPRRGNMARRVGKSAPILE